MKVVEQSNCVNQGPCCAMRLVLVAIYALLFTVSAAQADPASPRFTLPYLGGNIGTAQVQNSDRFDPSVTANAYGGFYLFRNLSAEVWLAYLGQFDIKNRTNTYSQSSGLGATLAYRIDTGKLFALRPNIGFFYSRTKIVFDGNDIGDDSGANLLVGLSGVFTVREHLLVNINTHFYKDVSGADILSLTAGAGYQF
jgi:hypothetical protein